MRNPSRCNRLDGCKWSSSRQICRRTGGGTPQTQGCESITSRQKCNNKRSCSWNRGRCTRDDPPIIECPHCHEQVDDALECTASCTADASSSCKAEAKAECKSTCDDNDPILTKGRRRDVRDTFVFNVGNGNVFDCHTDINSHNDITVSCPHYHECSSCVATTTASCLVTATAECTAECSL